MDTRLDGDSENDMEDDPDTDLLDTDMLPELLVCQSNIK
jgi:hypothetical protein